MKTLFVILALALVFASVIGFILPWLPAFSNASPAAIPVISIDETVPMFRTACMPPPCGCSTPEC